MPGVFTIDNPCRAARPERGCTSATKPTGRAIAMPVGTSARSPGARVTSTVVSRSAPASPGCEYAGSGSWLYKNKPNELVIQNGVFSRVGCERIIRYAYELAKKEHKTLTSVSKGNALNYSMVFWDQIFKEVGAEYPEVETSSLLVDAASMFMIKDPKRFQVVVTSNLFGDILTDLGAAIAGGMGLAAGANLNPERSYPSMFEPIHGSAPDIAGKGIANPLASIWSASQILDFFGYEDLGLKVLKAIEQLLVEKTTLTPDVGGNAATSEVGDAIMAILKRF